MTPRLAHYRPVSTRPQARRVSESSTPHHHPTGCTLEGMGNVINPSRIGDQTGGVGALALVHEPEAEAESEVSCVATLTVEQREDWVVTLRDAGVSFAAIGEVMEVSKQRAHTIYKRAIVNCPGKYSLDVGRCVDATWRLGSYCSSRTWSGGSSTDESPLVKNEVSSLPAGAKGAGGVVGVGATEADGSGPRHHDGAGQPDRR